MKAVVFRKKEGPDKLFYREVDKPMPTNDEVLVKILAASLNAADYRSIKMGSIPKRRIFGADIAGKVVLVGENCNKFREGNEVIGELSGFGFGGLAEYTTAPEKVLALKPANITFTDAAALPLAATTALQALRKGNVKERQNVLVVGSSGGVGSFTVQLAKHFGAVVTGVCSSKNVEQTKAIGADHVIDYTKEDLSKNKGSYDLIVAVNGNNSPSCYKRLLSEHGICVVVGGSLSQIFKSLFFGWLLSFGSKKIRLLRAKTSHQDLEFIAKLAGQGKIKPVIEKRYPLEKTPDAMRYLNEGHARGKVVIDIAEN